MAIPTIKKSVVADLDYGIDLAPSPALAKFPWLVPGEIVTQLVMTADEGITINSQSIADNSRGVPGALLVAWVSGGELGKTYALHFQFSTNLGRTDMRSVFLYIVPR